MCSDNVNEGAANNADEEIAISVKGLSKSYALYERPLARVADLLLPGEAKRFRPFWALKDINFDIVKGQTVGIVGRNGSGKSTLLEIISDTLQATAGEVTVNGRIAALLELGAGFNPEFTGRENVLMNAAIMGIEQDIIKEKLSEIEEFANIGEHINHPVKTYSSGMFVRLAFATSIHMDPEILIVDEALAVGDIRFQRKCFREFEKFKRKGKTILFVTHAVDLITSYCDSAIFLHQGEIRSQGEPKEVVYDYLDMMFGSNDEQAPSSKVIVDKKVASATGDVSSKTKRSLAQLNQNPEIDGAKFRRSYSSNEYRWGGQQAQIIDYKLESDGECDPVVFQQGVQLDVTMQVYFHQPFDQLIYGITIKTLDGVTVYGANTRERKIETAQQTAGSQAEIKFSMKLNLIRGEYFVSLGVAQLQDRENDNLALDRRYDLFSIAVHGESPDFGLADLGMAYSESKTQ